ncbi:ATP-binding cassette domain-containing protein [Streptomyces sp. NPDC087219]|uniref:ATP-binding cassette domain-containing protein n=1 Tax=unclassified Streptomyces TaxID=2593676 RepID=UPI0037F996D4
MTYKLAVEDLTVVFGHGSRATTVLDRVSVGVRAGRTLGLVGESGSGKSTVARTIVGINRPRTGRITLDGRDLAGLKGRDLTAVRRRIQLVSQDPYATLNPRMTVGQAIAEAVDPARADARRHAATVARWLETVSLDASAGDRCPHEFSGGQRQRIAIARALAVEPEVVIADEITSALDSSVQAEILNLLAALRRALDLTLVFISHDLAVVRHVSDEVAVLRHGELVEQGPCRDVYRAPSHPYTRRLLASVPGPTDADQESAA